MKDLVKQILSFAQEIPGPSGTTTSGTRTKGTPSKGQPSKAKSPAEIKQMQDGNVYVKEMQKSMIKLAQTVRDDVIYSDLPLDNPQDINRQRAMKGQNLGRGSFMDFFAQNFIGILPEDKRGVEYDEDPSVTSRPAKQKTQTSIYQMNSVMTTIMRLGRASNETKPDGNWQWRTQNSLRNIAGFSFALLQMGGELGISSPEIYSLADWRRFQNNISEIDKKYFGAGAVAMKPPQKKANAMLMKKYVDKILALYQNFREQALHARASMYISGKLPFENFQPTSQEDKAKKLQEQEYLDTYRESSDIVSFPGFKYLINKPIPGSPSERYNFAQYIPLKALSSKEEYLTWMASVGVTENIALQMLEGIKKQIDSTIR